LLVLDDSSPLLAGREADNLLDTWLFAGNANLIRDVMVNGQWCVQEFRHRNEEQVANDYRAAITRLTV
jgi:formimidoylglutamate deiminase